MKRYICFIAILFTVFVLISCKQDSDYNGTTEVEVEFSFDEVFEYSKNVYTATLLEYENNTLDSDPKYRLKFKIETVFKGEYYQNDIVEEILVSSDYLYERYTKFIIGERYLYMSGVDPNYEGSKKYGTYIFEKQEPFFKIIRIGHDGELYQAADFYRGSSVLDNQFVPQNDIALIKRILNLDPMYAYYEDKTLLEVYDESENVYVAKLISCKRIEDFYEDYDPGSDDWGNLYDAKLEVLSVIKGDISPKDIVTDKIIHYSAPLHYEWRDEYGLNLIVFVMSNDTVLAETTQPAA